MMSSDPPTIAVSMRDACNLTGLSRSTLNRLSAEGELRKLHCGTKVLYLYSELLTFIHNLPAT